jgi:predicted  nucleic acid-binding Zn-ribbon protein
MRKTTTNRQSALPSAEVSALQERINAWIERLEHKAHALVESTDIEELSAKERLDLALKVMQQIQRFVTLRQQLEAIIQPDEATESQDMISNLMRQMRGE